MEADDLCCAVTVLLDQMPDWMAEEEGVTPSDVRNRLSKLEPFFESLNLVARGIKHRELDRGPHKGLRDVITSGKKTRDGFISPPWFYAKPEDKILHSEQVIKVCITVLASELGVKLD